MSVSAIIDKIAKLLKLANNPGANPNEAANAAAMAQDLLMTHKLDMADIAAKSSDDKVNFEPIEDVDLFNQGGRGARWREWLASSVAGANGCRIYLTPSRYHGNHIRIVGRRSDIQAVNYLFGYLNLEAERMCGVAIKQQAPMDKGTGRIWANNFKLGFTEVVSKRLRETKQQMEVKAQTERPTAMVLVKKDEAAVDAFYSKLKLKSGSASSYVGNNAARDHGRNAGGSVTLGAGRGSIAGSKQRLS